MVPTTATARTRPQPRARAAMISTFLPSARGFPSAAVYRGGKWRAAWTILSSLTLVQDSFSERKAAERRQTIARGASPGEMCNQKQSSPGGATEKNALPREKPAGRVCRPSGARLIDPGPVPGARAPGKYFSPLRGFFAAGPCGSGSWRLSTASSRNTSYSGRKMSVFRSAFSRESLF